MATAKKAAQAKKEKKYNISLQTRGKFLRIFELHAMRDELFYKGISIPFFWKRKLRIINELIVEARADASVDLLHEFPELRDRKAYFSIKDGICLGECPHN